MFLAVHQTWVHTTLNAKDEQEVRPASAASEPSSVPSAALMLKLISGDTSVALAWMAYAFAFARIGGAFAAVHDFCCRLIAASRDRLSFFVAVTRHLQRSVLQLCSFIVEQ